MRAVWAVWAVRGVGVAFHGRVRAVGAVRGGGGEGGVAGLLFMAGALEGGGKCERWGRGRCGRCGR